MQQLSATPPKPGLGKSSIRLLSRTVGRKKKPTHKGGGWTSYEPRIQESGTSSTGRPSRRALRLDNTIGCFSLRWLHLTRQAGSVHVWAALLCLSCTGLSAEWRSGEHFRYLPLAVDSGGNPGFKLMESTGIAFTNTLSGANAGQNQIRLNGSGVALGDVDGDGWCDIFCCSLEGHLALFRNLGGWKFTNWTAAAGLDLPGNWSTGATLADVDGDGDLDLLVNSIGGGTKLFYNDGRGHFSEAPQSGLSSSGLCLNAGAERKCFSASRWTLRSSVV